MEQNFYDCIDCGTENCPCYLAATGDCLVCSRLAGKDYCDCNWKGVCIYNEFIQSGKKINNVREEFTAKVEENKRYGQDTVVLVLDVGRGFALKCAKPGSYVFLKRAEDEDFYNIPISVMKSDITGGKIHLAVKEMSAKSKRITEVQPHFEHIDAQLIVQAKPMKILRAAINARILAERIRSAFAACTETAFLE